MRGKITTPLPPPVLRSPMPRMVLLEHVFPDGQSHFDWLIEPIGLRRTSLTEPLDPDARVLLAFRLTERIDSNAADSFVAVRLPDHRRRYLNFEGEISPEKGFVIRQAHGRVKYVKVEPDDIEIGGQFVLRRQCVWKGRRDGIGWLFTCSSKPIARDDDDDDYDL